jgi:hypothetical protein
LPQSFHNPELNPFLLRAFEQENEMQIARVIFVGSLATLVAATAPALAKNSQYQQTQKTTEEQASSASCHAYQQAPDGTWTALPCQEHGGRAQAQQRQATNR